jgi:hypothetical protein
MKKILILVIILAAGSAGGTLYLVNKEIPAPDLKTEKVISNEKFLK